MDSVGAARRVMRFAEKTAAASKAIDRTIEV